MRCKTKCDKKTVQVVVAEFVYSDTRVPQLLEGVPGAITIIVYCSINGAHFSSPTMLSLMVP